MLNMRNIDDYPMPHVQNLFEKKKSCRKIEGENGRDGRRRGSESELEARPRIGPLTNSNYLIALGPGALNKKQVDYP